MSAAQAFGDGGLGWRWGGMAAIAAERPSDGQDLATISLRPGYDLATTSLRPRYDLATISLRSRYDLAMISL